MKLVIRNIKSNGGPFVASLRVGKIQLMIWLRRQRYYYGRADTFAAFLYGERTFTLRLRPKAERWTRFRPISVAERMEILGWTDVTDSILRDSCVKCHTSGTE